MEKQKSDKEQGFTLAEIVISLAVFSLMVIGIANAFNTVDNLYARTRQLTEMYVVLSACPEIDRALQYESITTSNCFPSNIFDVEGDSGGQLTYIPTASVTSTENLPTGDPLRSVPDSKVIDIGVDYLNENSNPWAIRLLISRNGIGQQ